MIGALLATVGGFVASQVEWVIRRRERERSAALLFGELLTMIKLIMRLAEETRGRGDPYGPVTMRFLRAAQRETEIYDRNRETLFDLRDAAIRARIHTLVARITFSLEGVSDVSAEIATERIAGASEQDDPARSQAEHRLITLQQNRQAAFEFALEATQQIDSVLSVLAPLAKHAFDAHDTVLQSQQLTQIQTAPNPTDLADR